MLVPCLRGLVGVGGGGASSGKRDWTACMELPWAFVNGLVLQQRSPHVQLEGEAETGPRGARQGGRTGERPEGGGRLDFGRGLAQRLAAF